MHDASGRQEQALAMSTLNLAATRLEDCTEEAESVASERSFVATSPAMRRLLDQASIVAPHLRIATIEGESGSGKHTLSRLLYERYEARHPEIQQWGFDRWDARDWLLSQSDPRSLAGFIFLERVDLLGTPGQALLLRILKELDFRQGGTLVVLASSQSPLRELAHDAQFLTELALRLTSVRLGIPPLRERKEDIVPLANCFLERIANRYRIAPVILTSGAIARLMEHHWPGNLRELSSILESAVIECSGGIIRAEDLSLPIVAAPASASIRNPELLNLDAVIHHHILQVLDMNRGNKLRTARQLGISRSTLYRLLDKRLSFCG
jgi:DNA-binding NtrC family response regulator